MANSTNDLKTGPKTQGGATSWQMWTHYIAPVVLITNIQGPLQHRDPTRNRDGWQSVIMVQREASWLWTHMAEATGVEHQVSTNLLATPDHIFKDLCVQSIILKSSEDGHWLSTATGPQKATVPETLEITVFLLLFSQHTYSFNSFYPLCVCDWKVFFSFFFFTLYWSIVNL